MERIKAKLLLIYDYYVLHDHPKLPGHPIFETRRVHYDQIWILQYDLQSKERFSLMVKYASPHLILQID